jgi:glycosyltransferase involved in cell wall biosynthesis
MSVKLPISVFIIARNEADRIGVTIKSVIDWVDEVIVIDSGSEDKTVEVAESFGAKTFFNAWNGYGLQKRFGEDKCKNRWLLNIDADEEITPALADEIQQVFAAGKPQFAAYSIPVRDLLPGETELARGAHTNTCIRLYNREHARFSDSPVHDSVIVQRGQVGALTQPALHRSFRSLAHAIEKMNSYTTAQAKHLCKRRMFLPHVRLVLEFPVSFFKDYILRLYCLRGLRGFTYAIVYAFSRVVRIAKYLELKNKT